MDLSEEPLQAHLEIVCGWAQGGKEGETAQEENGMVSQDERGFLGQEPVRTAAVPGPESGAVPKAEAALQEPAEVSVGTSLGEHCSRVAARGTEAGSPQKESQRSG